MLQHTERGLKKLSEVFLQESPLSCWAKQSNNFVYGNTYFLQLNNCKWIDEWDGIFFKKKKEQNIPGMSRAREWQDLQHTRENTVITFVTKDVVDRYDLLFDSSKNLLCDAKFMPLQPVYQMEKNVLQHGKGEQEKPRLCEEAVVAGEDKLVWGRPVTNGSKVFQVWS